MNRRAFRILSVIMTALIVFNCRFFSYAEEDVKSRVFDEEDKIGRLPVYCMDNGNQKWLQVRVHEDMLYVNSKSFASKFGYLMAQTEDSVQFLQCANSEGEEYLWTLVSIFSIDSNEVKLFDGTDTYYYESPYKCIEDKDEVWIPLQFALKLMGRELCVNQGVIIVSRPHEPQFVIINNTDRKRGTDIYNCVQISKLMNALGYEVNADPCVYEAIYDEGEKYGWLYKYVENAPELGEATDDGLDELATYLVSNVSPENEAMFAVYYELMQMYMSPELILAGGDVAGSLLSSTGEWSEEEIESGKQIVEASAMSINNGNTPNLAYNDAYRRAYRGLAGLDPIDMEWVDEMIYDELCASLIVYSGDPDDAAFTTLSYAVSLLGNLGSLFEVHALESIGGISDFLTPILVEIQCSKNMLAEDDYSSSCFESYVDRRSDYRDEWVRYLRNSNLVQHINERADDYDAYQIELIEKYKTSGVMDPISGEIKNSFEEGLKEIEGAVPLFRLINIGIDYTEYVQKMNEIAETKLKKDTGAYRYSKQFAAEIQDYIALHKDDPEVLDWAYCYYKTDYISNFYYLNSLGGSESEVWENYNEYSQIKRRFEEVIKEDIYHMAEIRAGIRYGIAPEENEEYNAIYDDGVLLDYINYNVFSTGNTNANINAYGFVTETESNLFEVNAKDYYHVYMTSKDSGDKIQVTDCPGMWLNAIEIEGNDYLYYIDNSGSINVYDVSNETNTIIEEGSYSTLMVAYGFMFAKENGTLYAFELLPPSEVGDKIELFNDVGECVAYTDDYIYYTDSNGDLYKTDLDGENKQSLGINTGSFDISNGCIYYSDNNDGGRIYLYNELTGISTKMSDVESTYCINLNKGMIYYKVGDDISEGLVYSLVPFIDEPITRIYSWEGDDDEIGVEVPSDLVTDFGRSNQRLYNVANGKIYNEGYLWILSEYPLAGINKNAILGLIGYKLSGWVHQ
ncbi:MAG: DUF5050 domain-containing protein [Lachnospiraceae bacterium]|nr:DUF5050 domain-containing protein [Lachnospiraceae bacterium]